MKSKFEQAVKRQAYKAVPDKWEAVKEKAGVCTPEKKEGKVVKFRTKAIASIAASFTIVIVAVSVAVGVSSHKNTPEKSGITVTDETAPVLKLKTEKTELLKEAPFSCQSYVFSAEDNVDRDLKDQVICSDVLQDTETQEVRYTVKDSAGNEAHAVLAVHFADYGEPLREAETERVASVSPAASVPTRTAPPVTVIEPVLS